MRSEEFKLPSVDGVQLFCRSWLPQPAEPVRAVVQIVHGMAEHCARYQRLAAELNLAGYAVYAHDHRGHGYTATNDSGLGYYADDDGWRKVVDDVHRVNRHVAECHPGLPIFILGHSMGSFITQQYIADYGDTVAGAALSASHGKLGPLRLAGMAVVRAEALRKGWHFRSPIVAKMSFGSFNDAFKPNRTESDWLSRDEREVDKYVADPFCGFDCTNRLWLDLFGGLGSIEKPATKARVPKNLPLYLFTGSADPVTHGCKGTQELKQEYEQAGLRNIRFKCYRDARHETFNETNRNEVTADFIDWLRSAL